MNTLLKKIKLLDVTLRDGGYRNNFSFCMQYVLSHVKKIHEAGIEFIEIGYRNGSVLPIENIGVTGLCSNDYLQAIHKEVPEMNLVVMAHAANICESDIYEMAENGVAMIRFCVTPKNIDKTFELAAVAKQLGMITSFNLVRISSISMPLLKDFVYRIHENRKIVDIIYFADSNGHLNPEAVSDTVELIKGITNIEIGFHPHDNLGLAMSNTINAIKHGVTFVDASLLGMGKGTGNLRLEQWIAYSLSVGCDKYSLDRVLAAVSSLRDGPDYVIQEGKEYNQDMMCGLFNLPFTSRNEIEERLSKP